jgi:hypothetical protein
MIDRANEWRILADRTFVFELPFFEKGLDGALAPRTGVFVVDLLVSGIKAMARAAAIQGCWDLD